jgi:predicted nucleic acid-binding protein
VTERVGLLDTGPLVSFLAADVEYHAWAVDQWKELRPPLLTCEPVLTEAAFLLRREGRDTDSLFTLLERGVIRIAIAVGEREQADLRALIPKPAHVIGRRLPRDSPCGRGSYTRRRFQNLPQARQ